MKPVMEIQSRILLMLLIVLLIIFVPVTIFFLLWCAFIRNYEEEEIERWNKKHDIFQAKGALCPPTPQVPETSGWNADSLRTTASRLHVEEDFWIDKYGEIRFKKKP